MFAFLQKKIAIPAQSQVTACNWGKEDGWLGIGGSQGLLKVIKLDDGKGKAEPGQPSGQLTENATLESHTGNVNIICWNEKYRKLTTADSNGLIIVYMRHKGEWFEEMINNRKMSTVRDMRWSPDGTKVAIIYQDGHVIIGGVEGSRKWGKDLKHRLALIQWSPDSRLILFGTMEGQVWVYDENGEPISQIRMVGLQKIVEPANFLSPKIPLASIEWFQTAKMYTDDAPVGLCIAYQCGRIILMKNDKDDDPIAVDTSMQLSKIRWNPTGTLLAAAGNSLEFQQRKGIVKFFDSKGNHLRNLKIPNCETVTDISWQGTGLRLSIGAASNIYCAAIKPNYKWCYLSNGTIVFGYQKSDRIDFCLVFWEPKSDRKVFKYVKDLAEVKGEGEYCAVFSKIDDDATVQIDLCNSIGTTLETKFVNLDVIAYHMSKTHIIIISQSYIYLWHYRSQTSRLTMFEPSAQTSLRRIGRELCWFIDDKPDLNTIYDRQHFDNTRECQDIICCVAANESVLIIGRESGVLQRFTLPHIAEETRLFWKPLPAMIGINSDSTRLALVDISGTLNILEIDSQGGNVLEFEKKDCWSLKWSEDHPHQLVFMQKSKLTILQNLTVDPQLPTDGYICCFKDLKVTYCYLDDMIKAADDNLQYNDLFIEHESSLLSNFLETYKKQGIAKAVKFAEDNSHQSLWKILAEKALEDLDYRTAEKALLKIDDYKALKLMKRIETLDDKDKQRAEVLAFYGRYDDAQALYKKIDRKDLAVQMRVKIGDWFRVLQMIREGSGYDETLLKITDELGNFYAEKFKWDRAAEFYLLSKNYKGLIEAFTRMEDYDNLSQIITEIPENDPLLIDLAERFQMVGLAEHAVKCYQRAGQIKTAIDCCVLLNHWNIAVDLAQKHRFMQIQGLLQQYAQDLLSKNRRLEAAELYRKAKRNTEAAKLLSQIANDLIDRESKPIYIKKLYVMAALEVDLYKNRLIDATMTGQANTTKTLDSLITSDVNTSSQKILSNPWRGGEAWHYFILCQKQLYAGQFRAALKTALRLAEYELEIEARKIYGLIAIAAYYNKSYKQCSRAFVKLEGMGSPEDREKFQEVAVSIFTRHSPKESQAEKFPCPGRDCKNQVTEYETSCRACGSNFQACVLTGRSILTKEYYTCKVCRHKMIENEIEKVELKYCALCHTPVDYKKLGIRNDD